jgi:hypothetical protein
MKAVTIPHTVIHLDNKGYHIYLGNGTRHCFSSEKKAKRFLAITNAALTQNLYEARLLYIEVNKQYQENWGYFVPGHIQYGHYLSIEREIRNNLAGIDAAFDWISIRTSTNYNYFVFTKFNYIICALKHILKELSLIGKKRSNTYQLYNYDSLFRRILTLEITINNYGQAEALTLFKPPTHLTGNEQEQFIPELRIA